MTCHCLDNMTPAQMRRRRWRLRWFRVKSKFYEWRWPLWAWLDWVWLWSPRLQAATKRYHRWRYHRSLKRERRRDLRRERQQQPAEAKRRQDWSPELIELHERLIRLTHNGCKP